jgi:hypothetical protein
LLWHAGGWDRDKRGGFDPTFRAAETASDVGTPPPHSCETIIRWMMGKPLDFDPGTRSDMTMGKAYREVTAWPSHDMSANSIPQSGCGVDLI